MLWLLIIAFLGVMLFVMFHKPQIKVNHSFTDVKIDPPAAMPKPAASETAPVVAPPTVDTFNFNDLYGSTKTPPSDQRNA